MVTLTFSTINSEVDAIDVIPGNAKAPPDGLNSVMISHAYVQAGDKYSQSQNLGLNTKVDSNQLLLRFTRTFKIADQPAALYIQPTVGTTSPGGSLGNLQDSSGLGDTAFALAFWPYADHDKKQYFATTGYFLAPTGEYDSNRQINQGKNRYSTAFQVAYQTCFTNDLSGMLATDVQWFDENDDYPLTHQKYEQKPLFSMQVSLMYQPSPRYLIATSYFLHKGGKSKLDNIAQNDEIERDRFQLAIRGNYSFGNIIFQYGKDLHTENGFFENHRAFLRYQYNWK